MIFNHNHSKQIFIHIPKTGGNTISDYIFRKGTSDEKRFRRSTQDGIDRFAVIGEFTDYKHQSLHEYYQKCGDLTRLPILTIFREPFHRMVSSYFSPHRHVKKDPVSGQLFFPENVVFNETKFQKLVNSSKSSCEMLSTRPDMIKLPDRK